MGATGGAEQFNWEQLAADIETGVLTPCVTNPSLREAVAGILRLGSKRERAREEGEKKQREKRGKLADMWVPLPFVMHLSETTFQNSLMVKYVQF